MLNPFVACVPLLFQYFPRSQQQILEHIKNFLTLKNVIAPFCGWGSTVSRLQNHEETVYFLPLSSWGSYSFNRPKAELTLKSRSGTAQKMKFPSKDFFSKCDQTLALSGLKQSTL